MSTAVIRPGLLVSLKNSVHGGVSYDHEQVEREDRKGKREVVAWKTTRTIEDKEEREDAVEVRSKAVSGIKRVCANTSFGLLCSEDREKELDEAIREARRISDEFNAASKFTKIVIYVLKGRVASTDEEAARAVASEVTTLLNQMNEGIRKADPKAIREAASRAQELGAVLAEDKAEAVSSAVTAARKAAREIVKRVVKEGESAERVMKSLSTKKIEAARFAFLDLEEGKKPDAPEEKGKKLPPVNVKRFAEVV